MFKKSFTLIMSILVVVTIALASVGSSSAADGPVVNEWRIPTLMFFSGPFAGDAAQYRWLIETYAADVNKAGGVAGKPYVPVFLDTAFDPSKAAAAMAKAIDMKALCVQGPLNDMESKAAMPLAVREGLFAFSGSSTTPVTKQFNPWMVYVGNSVDVLVQNYMPLWLAKEPTLKHVVTFKEPLFPMLDDIAKGNDAAIKGKGLKSTVIEVPVGKVDYAPIVLKALDAGADGFAFLTSQQTTAKIYLDLLRHNIKPNQMWVWILGYGEAFTDECKGKMEGLYTSSSQTWEFTSEFADLNKRYADSHNGKLLFPMAYSVLDMTKLIIKGIEELKITGDPAKLKEERIKMRDFGLNQKGFQGLIYKYDIENGLAQHLPIYLFQVQNGKDKLVNEVTP